MGNLLKIKAAFAAAAFFATGVQAQSATNSQLLGAPPLVEKASLADITDFLAPLGISVEPFEDSQADTFTVMATSESGGQFFVTLFACADPLTGAGCEGFSSYAGFSNAGFAYDDLNRFNTESSVSKAINIADQNAVIFGVQQYLTGGVTADNMQFITVLFLNDLDQFIISQENAGTAVSFSDKDRESSGTKTDNILDATESELLTSFGRVSMPAAISSAINNTTGVRFTPAMRP